MVTVKIYLRKEKKRKDGTCPLAFRITKDRKPRVVYIGIYLEEKHWNEEKSQVKKSHPNSTTLNNLIRKKLAEAQNTIYDVTTKKENISSSEIKKVIKREGKGTSFFDVAKERILRYEQKGTFSVSNAEKSIMNNFKKFLKGADITFEEITPSLIEKFKIFCKTELGQKSTRTITNQVIFIRTVYNIAIKEGIVDSKHYPFSGDNVKIRIGSGLKIGLTEGEVLSIESLPLEEGSTTWHTRNVWLFSFYFAGVRISDVLELKWSDFNDGRLHYIMNKNEKPVTLKVPEKALKILDYYKHDKRFPNDYVFPDLKKANPFDERDIFRKIRNASRNFNKHLKRIADLAGIEKNLSNHISRHSFGNIAGDKINPLMLQKLYRHSDLKTTINYQGNFIHKEADEALEAVINF